MGFLTAHNRYLLAKSCSLVNCAELCRLHILCHTLSGKGLIFSKKNLVHGLAVVRRSRHINKPDLGTDCDQLKLAYRAPMPFLVLDESP